MNTTESSFEACAFNPNQGNESVVGQLIVSRWQVRFFSDSVTLDIPLERLHVRCGEGEDERLYFRDASQPDWEIITSDFSILDLPAIAAIDNIAEKLSAEASRLELRRRLRIVGYVAGACVVLAFLGQITLSLMVRSVVANLPPQMEKDIGDGMMSELQQEMKLLDDSNRVAELTALAGPLIQANGNGKTQLMFYLTEDDDPNAFALPGGHVIVTTGLLKMADRPEEVLGVIAHEVAHVTQKHGIRKAIAGAGPFLIFRVFLGGNSSGLVRVAGAASDLLIEQSFSQEYETEADDVGWQTLVAAQIDPRGMTEMFQKLLIHERGSELPGMELPQAFQSHPALEKRIARLERKSRGLKSQSGFQDLSSLQASLKAAADK